MKKLKLAFFVFFAGLIFGVPALLAQSRGNVAAHNEPPGSTSVLVRCAFWERPKDMPPAFYIRSTKGYKMLPVFAMAFGAPVEYRGPLPIPVCRKATEAEIEQRKASGVKGNELEYIPLFSINPRGMKDIGVLLLPGKTEGKSEKEVLVFDWSEKAFPFGTIRIANFSGRGLIGQLMPRDGEPEQFRLKNGGFYLSKPVNSERRVYGIQLAAMVNKKPEIVCSSNAVFRDSSRVMLFVIPKSKRGPDEIPDVDFRSIKDYKKAETPAPERGNGKQSGAPRRGGTPPPPPQHSR